MYDRVLLSMDGGSPTPQLEFPLPKAHPAGVLPRLGWPNPESDGMLSGPPVRGIHSR